jgi:hypothetical protein
MNTYALPQWQLHSPAKLLPKPRKHRSGVSLSTQAGIYGTCE